MKNTASKYATMASALIATAMPYAILLWGHGPDSKWIALASAVAGALGVHVTHVNSTKPSLPQLQQALVASGLVRPFTAQPPAGVTAPPATIPAVPAPVPGLPVVTSPVPPAMQPEPQQPQ